MNKKSALKVIDDYMEDSHHKEALKTYICNLVGELKLRQENDQNIKLERNEKRKINYNVRKSKHKNRKVL